MSERAELLARHVSPDGQLVWRIERETEASGKVVISFGFEGLDWHLHPDFFEANGRSPEQIADDVTAGVIEDRHVVVIETFPDDPFRMYLLETIEQELELSGTYADLRFRFWSGRSIDRAELLEGTVDYKPLGEKFTTR